MSCRRFILAFSNLEAQVRFLVFAHHLAMLDALEKSLREQSVRCLCIVIVVVINTTAASIGERKQQKQIGHSHELGLIDFISRGVVS